MCDPLTLAAAGGLGVASKLIGGNEAAEAAKRDAAARNAVLAQTIAKERGYNLDNQAQLSGNIAHYAPGAQDAQLVAAQTARAGRMTGNMTPDNAALPLPADTNPASSADLAKRMLAVHDGAVNRAGLNAKLGGFGDTWLKNNLATQEADRNIGVTNNYSEGAKAILPALQDDAAAAVYKSPSIWSTLLGGASSLAAGKAGAGNVWSNPSAGSGGPVGTMQVGDQFFPAFQ